MTKNKKTHVRDDMKGYRVGNVADIKVLPNCLSLSQGYPEILLLAVIHLPKPSITVQAGLVGEWVRVCVCIAMRNTVLGDDIMCIIFVL